MANLDNVYDVDDRTAAFENHQNGTLVSLAGPGTGKTYSLLRRVAALAVRGEDPEALCYLTFIKEISNAFVVDYVEEFGVDSYEENGPRISTLHSFACRVLRNQGFRINLNGDLYFTNAAEKDDAADTLINDLLALAAHEDCRTPAQMRRAVQAIKTAWRNRADPNTLDDPIPAVYQRAVEICRVYRLVDWDHSIPLVECLLRDGEQVPAWISKIEHYLVDEYQDFNAAERAFIDLLSQHATSVVVVGDVDQSLYSSRGGSPAAMQLLYDSRLGDRVSLVKCFRCRGNLVKVANQFQGAMGQEPRPMVPHQDGGDVMCYRFKSSKAELAYLTGLLNTCIAEMPDYPKPKEGTVCLFPSWRVLNSYHDALSSVVPSAKRKTVIDENRHWLDRILQLVRRPEQRFLQRLVLNRFADVRPRHRRRMLDRVLERDVSPAAAMNSLVVDGTITGASAVAATAYCEFCEVIVSRDPTRICRTIAALLQLSEESLLDPISDFIVALDEPDAEEAISRTCDLILPDTAEPPEDIHKVLFLTMHGSKGLTRKNVVMPGLENAWLPGSADGDELEERRRLFYVAVTRATDRVVMTFPSTRARGDSLNFPMPGRGEGSSFVVDAGLTFVYHE